MHLPDITLTVKTEPADDYQGQFSVCAAVITLRADDDLLPAMDAFIKRWGDFIAERGTGPRLKYQRILTVRDQLANAIAAGSGDLSFVTESDLRNVESDIVLGERFRSVYCPSCARDYAREELDIREWTCQWPDTARGGKRWVCPSGHTVAAHFTWIR